MKPNLRGVQNLLSQPIQVHAGLGGAGSGPKWASPCPVVGGGRLPFTQASENSPFSANLPQLLVFQTPHRGLGKDWNGR